MSSRLSPEAQRKLLNDGKIHRTGYHFDRTQRSKPEYDMVDITAVYDYGGMYVIFATYGDDKRLVSVQNSFTRDNGRAVVYFRCDHPERLKANPDFRRYARQRINTDPDSLANSIEHLIALESRRTCPAPPSRLP